MNPQSFDPAQIGRYTVVRVHYEYAGEPAGEKLFVVLRHDSAAQRDFCWCIKATSQVQRFTADMLKGCVFYAHGTVSFFTKDTVIDPSNILTLLHQTIANEAAKGRYRIEGKMPADFHQKFVDAVRASITLEPKKKMKLLEAVGETLVDTAPQAPPTGTPAVPAQRPKP
jgi:hypothetical protein